jgi:hypothetical protein
MEWVATCFPDTLDSCQPMPDEYPFWNPLDPRLIEDSVRLELVPDGIGIDKGPYLAPFCVSFDWLYISGEGGIRRYLIATDNGVNFTQKVNTLPPIIPPHQDGRA